MNMISHAAAIALFAFTIAAGGVAQAATVYDETTSGDFSSNGATPNPLAFGLGDNQIFGVTGRSVEGVVDRDYFTFTLSSGFALTAVQVLPGTTSIGGGSLSFIGMESGSQMTVLPTAANAAGLLGWRHYGPADINTDILDDMAIPAAGSSGFKTPLGPGSYSVWIQETATGTAKYGLNFHVAAVPEPAVWAMMIVGFGMVGAAMRQSRVSVRLAG